MVKRPLDGHEALMLHRLSGEYAEMVNEASKPNCPPPFVIDTEASKSAASIQLGKILDAMIAERNKK